MVCIVSPGARFKLHYHWTISTYWQLAFTYICVHLGVVQSLDQPKRNLSRGKIVCIRQDVGILYSH